MHKTAFKFHNLASVFNAYAIWFSAVLSVTLFHRLFAIGYYADNTFRATYQPGGLQNAMALWVDILGSSTLLGVTYDILFAALFGLPLIFLPMVGRLFVLAVLAAFFTANFDHIIFNYEHINFSTANIGVDITFLKGMFRQSLLIVFVVLCVCGFATVFIQKLTIIRRFFRVSSVIAIIAALLAPQNGSFADPLWLQSNPFLGSPLDASDTNQTQEFSIEALAPRAISMEVPPKHNVLLVYMEGLSQHSLRLGDMDYLSSLADNNISFTRHVGPQLITANGLFSSLTGYLPFLAKGGLKWFAADASSQAMSGSFPNYLRAQGYHTAFLQSASLEFMLKGEIMPLFGFDTVLGRDSWKRYYSVDGWGIDDRALFEHTVAYIDTLQKDTPWFVSVLTTGTHAPYNVPAEYLPNENRERYRALRYLDESLSELMISLEERGLLKETIVVLTSDEARGSSVSGQIQNQLALNWLPLIVIHPSGANAAIDGYISATQLPDLIADLQVEDVSTYLSSLDTEDHPFVFGNIHSKRMYWYDATTQVFLICLISSFVCAEYDGVADPFAMQDRVPKSVQVYPQLQNLIVQADSAL